MASGVRPKKTLAITYFWPAKCRCLPPFSTASYAIAIPRACARGRDGDQGAAGRKPITLAARERTRVQLLRGSSTHCYRPRLLMWKRPRSAMPINHVVDVIRARDAHHQAGRASST
jgi:ABC-type hemin transport system ATPase subunit